MTEDAARQLVVDLIAAFPKVTMTPRTESLYVDELRLLNEDKTREAITALIRTKKTLPAVADIRAQAGKEAVTNVDTGLSTRALEIARMLAEVSNTTLSSAARWAIADNLQWQLGDGVTTREAGHLGEQARIALGWSDHGPTAAQQIREKYRPKGIAPTAKEWLRAAGFITDSGLENLPAEKTPVPGARERVRAMLTEFCVSRGMPAPTFQEVADDRKPTVDPDPDEYDRRYR